MGARNTKINKKVKKCVSINIYFFKVIFLSRPINHQVLLRFQQVCRNARRGSADI